MELKELQLFIKKESERLSLRYKNETEKERILARTVKLNEEVGELCQEILRNLDEKRDRKFSNENLKMEFADVILTTMLIAEKMNINLEESIQNKIKNIEAKYLK